MKPTGEERNERYRRLCESVIIQTVRQGTSLIFAACSPQVNRANDQQDEIELFSGARSALKGNSHFKIGKTFQTFHSQSPSFRTYSDKKV